MAVMAMDAATCYDRMRTCLSNICERQHGLPKTVCKAKSHKIFEILCRVRTAYGESEEYYTSVIGEDLIHGEYQGKTLLPPSWEIYKIKMLRVLDKFNPGVSISCVEGKRMVHRLKYIFVDDKDM